jgi:hypothetical protein
LENIVVFLKFSISGLRWLKNWTRIRIRLSTGRLRLKWIQIRWESEFDFARQHVEIVLTVRTFLDWKIVLWQQGEWIRKTKRS